MQFCCGRSVSKTGRARDRLGRRDLRGLSTKYARAGKLRRLENQNQSFADMAASHETSFNLTGDGEPERVSAYSVTANFFPLLGVQPLLGRSFLTEEDRPGANKVVVSATASGRVAMAPIETFSTARSF